MNMEKIKVSIIVPVYNVENYIEKCIKSLLNQTLEEIEIIVINDGSQDNSIKIIEESFSDERLAIYHQENRGISEARNNGLKKAHGEYILFVDSDDFIDKNMCEELYKNSNDGDIIFSNYYANYGDRKEEFNFNKKIKRYFKLNLEKNTKFNGKLIYERSLAAVWDKLYKRSFLIENNLFFTPKILHEDLNFSLKAFFLSENIYYYNQAYYYYWQNNNNSIINSMKKERELESYEKIVEDLEKFYMLLNDNFKKLRVILIISQYIAIIFELKNEDLDKEKIDKILLRIKGNMNFNLSKNEKIVIKHELELLLNMKSVIKNIKIKEVIYSIKKFNLYSFGIKLCRKKIKNILKK